MRVAVAPFLVPEPDVAQHLGWSLIAQESSPLPRLVETWDYQSELRLQGGLAIDRARICEQANLADSSELEVIVIARSTATKVERCVLRLSVPAIPQLDLPLEFVLRGDWLGGRLILETILVASRPVPIGKLSASQAGAILWTSRQDATLEGQGGLFPTDSEDFRETRPKHKDVPWILTVDQSDFESLFTASVRLTLNTGVRAIAEMLSNPTSNEAKRIARLLDLDVTRQLSLVAINAHDSMSRLPDPEGESLGDVLRLILARIWPTTPATTLDRWRVEQPERLELDIHQFIGAF